MRKSAKVTREDPEAGQDAEVDAANEEEDEGTGETAKDAEVDVKEEDADAETAKEPEKPKELEEDAAEDSRPKLEPGAAAISATDATLNVMPVANGKLLMSLGEGGFQYLLAGARATVGMKAGRYVTEVKIAESLNPSEAQGSQGRIPQPRQLVRVGVSVSGSSLFLSDSPDSVCFDSEGYFVYEKTRKKVSQKFTRDQVVALLVNLDPKSPNANTISLFRDGTRIAEPQPIPEQLQGKALFPTVTYKNVSLQVNFGPIATAPLPFKCPMLASAAKKDVEVVTAPEPKDGKWEVLMPVGLPEQGFFDWVDTFAEKHPDFVELSDRKILEWASKSGMWRSKGQAGAGSNDKPDMKFGIPSMDDLSVRRVLTAVAPTQARNYIIPELKANLVPAERAETLARFNGPEFRKTATVIVGEPSAAYKERVQELMLADKKAKTEAEKKKKAQEEERKRLLEEKRKKAEEARKAKEAAQKRKQGKEVDEKKEEEASKEEEAKKEEAPAEEGAPMELSAEEKELWYRKMETVDLDEQSLAKSYASFAMPKADEGFDSISYEWQDEASAAELLRKWVLERKMTQRVEDLQPGAAFKEHWAAWQKTLGEWRKMQTDYKDPAKRKAMLAKRKAEAAKKKKDDEGTEEAEEEEEAKPMEINAEDLDVSTVEDVTDIGNGEPLFQHFAYEDWVLLAARYEFHLLLHSFKQDLNDEDRPSFTEEHLAFYYNKYFKKSFTLKHFGVEKFVDFAEMIKETLSISKAKSFLEPLQEQDTPVTTFVKLTEEHRRERQRRIDAGDETAKLKFSRPAPPPPRQQPPQAPSRYGPGGGSSSAYNGSGGSGGSGAQKRPYGSAPSAYGSKQPRSYGSYGSGGGYYRR
eukprot:CAMPEP_0171071894 /NCGR_PEP_ID=MMETSP0766_2-20121228/10555_1 /TAXON_ID=439317 /ORGANISM="Gambierdiscus australes, Strain CAWD 149" /LENGTH=864 /DNA_ID=CAMNT_0011528447 /DNA_START=47 /DNA_END=2638 /DNA_ORIENTATION=-